MWIQRVIYFFPFQLLAAHFKRNHFLLVYWAFVFALITQSFANKYGIPNLLLYPEYLGEVNFLSHVILGLGCGAFVISFQITSYLINGVQFPFIATLAKPFLKYQLNNFIIPLTFYFIYVYQIFNFQYYSELVERSSVLFNLLGFVLGNGFFIGLSTIYFISTNKSIFKFLNLLPPHSQKKRKPIQELFDPNLKWYEFYKRKGDWKIESYINGKLQIALARSSQHYNKEILQQVFRQNHLNAFLFEIGAVFSVFIIGLFMENPVFAIPAGASLFLFLTLITLLSGALYHWLKGWSVLAFVILILLINALPKFTEISRQNRSYGLQYNGFLTKYDQKNINLLNNNLEKVNASYLEEIESLNKWKKESGSTTMVMINTSGGGLRAATWAFHCLQQSDSILNNKLLASTRVISGASGGMIGSAFYRDLYLYEVLQTNKANVSGNYIDDIASDMLNLLAFAWVANDFLIHYKFFEFDGETYAKDRAYYFEKELNDNTRGFLNKRLGFYTPYVNSGMIPEMILSPTIANDGRRLLIASRNTLYLNHNIDLEFLSKSGRVDFLSMFENQGATNMQFTSALRMSATFPYVLPNISLPTDPRIEIMDAGVRDNFGYKNTIDYLNVFSEWIDTAMENVVVLQIYDRPNLIKVQEDPYQSLLQVISTPVGSVYKNMFNIQRMEEERQFQQLDQKLKPKLKIVSLILDQASSAEIPLSWHITESSKKEIKKGYHSVKNMNSLNELKSLIK